MFVRTKVSSGVFFNCCFYETAPRHSAPSHVPCRADAKQDYERLGLGTPPTLLRQNSLGRPPSSTSRHTDDEGSLRRRAVKVGGRKKVTVLLFLWISAYVLIRESKSPFLSVRYACVCSASNRVQPQSTQWAGLELPQQLRLPASGSSRPDSAPSRGEPDPRIHQHRGHQRVRSSKKTPDISFTQMKIYVVDILSPMCTWTWDGCFLFF